MICPKCDTEIKTNGVGPSGAPKFNWLLQKIYYFSCKLFHKAANQHDCDYHIYGYGKQKADYNFFIAMGQAIEEEKCNWFTERWYNYQRIKFYNAVKFGGSDAYNDAQEVCLKQLNLNSRKIK
jgi:hypothetical protein